MNEDLHQPVVAPPLVIESGDSETEQPARCAAEVAAIKFGVARLFHEAARIEGNFNAAQRNAFWGGKGSLKKEAANLRRAAKLLESLLPESEGVTTTERWRNAQGHGSLPGAHPGNQKEL